MRHGSSERHGSHAGKSPRGIAPGAFLLRGASACSDGGHRPKPGPPLRGPHCPQYPTLRSRPTQSMNVRRAAGHAVSALAGRGPWSEARAAPLCCTGRRKTGGAIPRALVPGRRLPGLPEHRGKHRRCQLSGVGVLTARMVGSDHNRAAVGAVLEAVPEGWLRTDHHAARRE